MTCVTFIILFIILILLDGEPKIKTMELKSNYRMEKH